MGYKEIGKKLQMAREEAGLSQEQLASMLGCAQSTLSNYEKGKRRIYLAQLEQIAEVLGKPIEYFLETSTSSENSRKEELKNINSALDDEPELLQIINALYDLPREKRRSVMDYIIWQKTRSEGGK
ncbi:Helix-turn-helix [Thermosyntropha lipolytica DSM 11003]|uniref:Helix-turn-helix n=1 Tax=Thermosyntropha lipolytica DSM 11003 TaxID=1123382 RepID=A0A1M5N7X0_9FIRM|nr:helix-turn-helix transcriptional regulator [Thermosyntropha lipolytica]SHG85581.1 Helix-turn-helix [Thermosyntropha lipolytica DSM 11003]